MALKLLLEPRRETTGGIFIELTDQLGSPAYFKGLYITYVTDSLFHDLHKEGSAWIQDHDAGYKGYAFSEDFEWRYPPAVPNPSEYEIYPLPDFTQSPPQTDVDPEDVTVYSVGNTYINFGFAKAVSKVEIKNLPVGNYRISVSDVVVPENYTYNGITYYPDMYTEYDEDHPVDHVSGLCQVDKNSKFSGYAKLNLFDSSDGHPTGYDFYCITDKFPKNTMPVVARLIPPEPPVVKRKIKFVACLIEIPGLDFSFSGEYRGIDPQDTNETYLYGCNNTRTLAWKIYEDGAYLGYYSWFALLYGNEWFGDIVKHSKGDIDFKGDVYQGETWQYQRSETFVGRISSVYEGVGHLEDRYITRNKETKHVYSRYSTQDIYFTTAFDSYVEYSYTDWQESEDETTTYQSTGTVDYYDPYYEFVSKTIGYKYPYASTKARLGADTESKTYTSYRTYEIWNGEPHYPLDEYPEVIGEVAFRTDYLYLADGLTHDKFKDVFTMVPSADVETGFEN